MKSSTYANTAHNGAGEESNEVIGQLNTMSINETSVKVDNFECALDSIVAHFGRRKRSDDLIPEEGLGQYLNKNEFIPVLFTPMLDYRDLFWAGMPEHLRRDNWRTNLDFNTLPDGWCYLRTLKNKVVPNYDAAKILGPYPQFGRLVNYLDSINPKDLGGCYSLEFTCTMFGLMGHISNRGNLNFLELKRILESYPELKNVPIGSGEEEEVNDQVLDLMVYDTHDPDYNIPALVVLPEVQIETIHLDFSLASLLVRCSIPVLDVMLYNFCKYFCFNNAFIRNYLHKKAIMTRRFLSVLYDNINTLSAAIIMTHGIVDKKSRLHQNENFDRLIRTNIRNKLGGLLSDRINFGKILIIVFLKGCEATRDVPFGTCSENKNSNYYGLILTIVLSIAWLIRNWREIKKHVIDYKREISQSNYYGDYDKIPELRDNNHLQSSTISQHTVLFSQEEFDVMYNKWKHNSLLDYNYEHQFELQSPDTSADLMSDVSDDEYTTITAYTAPVVNALNVLIPDWKNTFMKYGKWVEVVTDIYQQFRIVTTETEPDIKWIAYGKIVLMAYHMLVEMNDSRVTNMLIDAWYPDKGFELQNMAEKTIPPWLLNMSANYDTLKSFVGGDLKLGLCSTYTVICTFIHSRLFNAGPSTSTLADFYITLNQKLTAEYDITPEKYFDVTFSLVQKYLVWYYTGVLDTDEGSVLEIRYNKLMIARDNLKNGSLITNSAVPMHSIVQELILECDQMIKELNVHIRSKSKDITSINRRLRFMNHEKQINNLKAQCKQILLSTKNKMQPFAVTIAGDAGVGKSKSIGALSDIVHSAYLLATCKKVSKNECRILDSDQYDSSVQNYSNMVIYDDVFLMKDHLSHVETAKKIFRFNSSIPQNAVKAALEEKDTVFINNHGLVMTTNQANLYCTELTTDAMALIRRAGFTMRMVCEPEYSIKDTKMADQEKINAAQDKIVPGRLSFHARYVPYKINSKGECHDYAIPGCRSDKSVDAKTMTTYIHKIAHEHFTNQCQLMKNLDVDVLCPKCGQVKCEDYSMCTCFCGLIEEPEPKTEPKVIEHQADPVSSAIDAFKILNEKHIQPGFAFHTTKAVESVFAGYREAIVGVYEPRRKTMASTGLAVTTLAAMVGGPISGVIGSLSLLTTGFCEWMRYVSIHQNPCLTEEVKTIKLKLARRTVTGYIFAMVVGLIGAPYFIRAIKKVFTYYFHKMFNTEDSKEILPAKGVELQYSLDEKIHLAQEARKTWTNARFCKADCTNEKLKSMDIDTVISKIQDITPYVEVSGNSTFFCMSCILLDENYIVMPAHPFTKDWSKIKWKMKFTIDSKTFIREVHGADIRQVGLHDLMLIRVHVLSKMSIKGWDIIPQKEMKVGSMMTRFICPEDETSWVRKYFTACSHISDTLEPFDSTWMYKPIRTRVLVDNKPWVGFNGACGNVLLSEDSPRCIIGMHTHTDKANCIGAVPLSQELLREYVDNSVVVKPNDFVGFPSHKYEKEVMIQLNTNVHKNHPVLHMPATVTTVGSIESSYSNKADIKTYKHKSTVQKCFNKFKDYSAGPNMNPTWCYRNMMVNSLSVSGIPEPLLKRAIKDYVKPVKELVDLWKEKNMKPLTKEEALNGRPEIGVNSMNFNASAGFMSGCKKKGMVDGEPGVRELKPEVSAEVDRYIECLKRKESPGCINNATLKAEPLPLQDDGIQKFARVFTVPEMSEAVVQKMYFAPVVAFMTLHNEEFENALGVNALSPQWEELFGSFFVEEPNDKVTGKGWMTDYSKFDLSLDKTLVSAAFRVIEEVLKEFYSEEELAIAEACFAEILTPTLAVRDCLFCPDNMMPSGNFLTSLITTICNCLINRCAFFDTVPEVDDFRAYIKMRALGDDNMAKDTPAANPDKYNPKIFAEVCAKWDIKVVNPSDKKKPPEYVKVEDLEFLSRKTKWCNVRKCLIGVLKEASLQKELTCYVQNGKLTSKERFSAVSMSCLHDTSGYSKECYDKMRYLLYCCFLVMEIPLGDQLCKTYEEVCESTTSENPTNRFRYPRAPTERFLSLKTADEIKEFFQEDYPELIFPEFEEVIKIINFKLSIPLNTFTFQAGTESAAAGIDLAKPNVTQAGLTDLVHDDEIQAGLEAEETIEDMVEFEDLQHAPTRPLRLTKQLVPLSQSLLFSLDVYERIFNERFFLQRIDNHAYTRFEVEVTITLTCSTDHYGSFLVYYYPLPIRSNLRLDLQTSTTIGEDSTMNSIIWDIQEGTVLKYKIPWIYPYNLVSVDAALNASEGYFGFLCIRTLCPLRTINTTHTSSVRMDFFAELKDLVISGPTSYTYLQGFFPKEKFSLTLREVSKITDSASKLFTGTSMMMPTQIATMTLNGISSIAEALGYSKPRQTSYVEYLRSGTVANIQVTSGPTNRRFIGPVISHETAINPSLTGMPMGDTLIIENLIRMPYIIANVIIPPNQISGYEILSFFVTPTQFLKDDSDSKFNKVHYSPMGSVSTFFKYWTGGTINFRLRFIKHNSHGGSINIFHDPIYTSNAVDVDFRKNKVMKIDLRTEKEINIKIGWVNNKPALLTERYDDYGVNGVIKVMLDNPITSTSNDVGNVSVIAEVWGENIEFFGFKGVKKNWKLADDYAKNETPLPTQAPATGTQVVGKILPLIPGIISTLTPIAPSEPLSLPGIVPIVEKIVNPIGVGVGTTTAVVPVKPPASIPIAPTTTAPKFTSDFTGVSNMNVIQIAQPYCWLTGPDGRNTALGSANQKVRVPPNTTFSMFILLPLNKGKCKMLWYNNEYIDVKMYYSNTLLKSWKAGIPLPAVPGPYNGSIFDSGSTATGWYLFKFDISVANQLVGTTADNGLFVPPQVILEIPDTFGTYQAFVNTTVVNASKITYVAGAGNQANTSRSIKGIKAGFIDNNTIVSNSGTLTVPSFTGIKGTRVMILAGTYSINYDNTTKSYNSSYDNWDIFYSTYDKSLTVTGVFDLHSVSYPLTKTLQATFNVGKTIRSVDKLLSTVAGEKILSMRSLMKTPNYFKTYDIPSGYLQFVPATPSRTGKSLDAMTYYTLSHLGLSGSVCFMIEIITNNKLLVSSAISNDSETDNPYEILYPSGDKVYIVEIPYYSMENFMVPRGSMTPSANRVWGNSDDSLNVSLDKFGINIRVESGTRWDSTCSINLWTFAGESYNPCGFMKTPRVYSEVTS